jgi:aquaporin NIP
MTELETNLMFLQVPLYLVAQVVGSVLASGTLYLLFDVDEESIFGTTPAGSNMQSLVFEILTSFLLMFVVSAVSTDNRAVSIYTQFTLINYICFLAFYFVL